MNGYSIFPFNELSLLELEDSSDVEKFYSRILKFKDLIYCNNNLKIAYPSCVLTQKCKDGKNLLDHISDSGLAKDSQGMLLATIQESPFLDEFEDKFLDHEVSFNGKKSIGSAHAVFFENSMFSLPTAPEWDKFEIEMDKIELDDSANVISNKVMVSNLGQLDDEKYLASWVSKLINNEKIDNPSFLIDKVLNECSCIILSDNAISYIHKLGSNTSKLNRIYDLFLLLHKYCTESWKFGAIRRSHISAYGVNVKDESEATMNKYGEERNFKDQNGNIAQYRFHFNLTDGERIYIGGIDSKKQIFIAYIGNHLRTVKYN